MAEVEGVAFEITGPDVYQLARFVFEYCDEPGNRVVKEDLGS